jgi:hypothetical protein
MDKGIITDSAIPTKEDLLSTSRSAVGELLDSAENNFVPESLLIVTGCNFVRSCIDKERQSYILTVETPAGTFIHIEMPNNDKWAEIRTPLQDRTWLLIGLGQRKVHEYCLFAWPQDLCLDSRLTEGLLMNRTSGYVVQVIMACMRNLITSESLYLAPLSGQGRRF